MTIKDINDIIKAVCPNDEDYEKPIISPKYLRQELEQLAIEQEHKHLEPTTKNDLAVDVPDTNDGNISEISICQGQQNDCGDAISRQAVIDALREYFHDEYYQRTSIQNCRDCFIEDVLNHLPSVTPETDCDACIPLDVQQACENGYAKGFNDAMRKIHISLRDEFKKWYQTGYEDCVKTYRLEQEPTTKNDLAVDCISRQAAINALKIAYWDKDIQSAKDDPCIVDAMTDWAIRQVKALPPVTERESSVDCVPRDVVRRIIKSPRSKEQMLSVLESVNAVQPVSPARQKGEWIEHLDEIGKWYECDQCYTEWGGSVNFCPNCGADMRGDNNEKND